MRLNRFNHCGRNFISIIARRRATCSCCRRAGRTRRSTSSRASASRASGRSAGPSRRRRRRRRRRRTAAGAPPADTSGRRRTAGGASSHAAFPREKLAHVCTCHSGVAITSLGLGGRGRRQGCCWGLLVARSHRSSGPRNMPLGGAIGGAPPFNRLRALVIMNQSGNLAFCSRPRGGGKAKKNRAAREIMVA